jgi:hypothetical protein
VKSIISSLGCRTTLFSTGQELMNFYASNHEAIDYLLID